MLHTLINYFFPVNLCVNLMGPWPLNLRLIEENVFPLLRSLLQEIAIQNTMYISCVFCCILGHPILSSDLTKQGIQQEMRKTVSCVYKDMLEETFRSA